MQLVLASASPRRAELLALLGVPFTVAPADVDEEIEPGWTPEQAVVELAARKALALASAGWNDELVLGADTLVAIDGEMLGKPHDRADALSMLRRLCGRMHDVWTGVALARSGSIVQSGAARTGVTFRAVPDDLLERYVDTGEPFDKAGAYAVQGYGAVLVARVDGCNNNVVGLPTALLCDMLQAEGVPLLNHVSID